MIRVIIILAAVFILLTVVRNLLKKYRSIKPPQNKSNQNTSTNKDPKKDQDNDIVDAKFEEIN
ncbi:MAG: hypothetical protein SGI89_14910 [bacterium]|nr:hypothetical protein [bacterium]